MPPLVLVWNAWIFVEPVVNIERLSMLLTRYTDGYGHAIVISWKAMSTEQGQKSVDHTQMHGEDHLDSGVEQTD